MKELENEAEEYRNRIAVTEKFYDSFKERMARKYSYNYDSDTSLDESETEEVIEINEKELNQCEMCNFSGKTEDKEA